MNTLLAVVLLTLLISAACSLFEATLYSTRVASLEAALDVERRQAAAEVFLRLKRDIAVPTSAILILNTIANTTGATLAGMLASELFGSQFIGLFSGLLTVAILFVAEILPKTFGATHWRSLWYVIVWPLVFMEKALRPLIWVTQAFAGLFVRGKAGPVTTQDEIVALIRMGADAGELSETEHRLIRSVFRFDELRVRDVMLPRRDVIFFDETFDVPRCLEEAVKSRHTRYPYCTRSLDDVRGLIHVKDLLPHLGSPEMDVTKLVRPMQRIPETRLLRDVLREMQRTHPHMALVVDERGSTVGAITLEQVLEQLVGAVDDEFDSADPDIVSAGPSTWIVRGRTPLPLVAEQLGLRILETEVSTLSGLVMHQRGQLPAQGDVVEIDGATLEVLEVGSHRAEKLKVTLTAVAAEVVEPADEETE